MKYPVKVEKPLLPTCRNSEKRFIGSNINSTLPTTSLGSRVYPTRMIAPEKRVVLSKSDKVREWSGEVMEIRGYHA
jgi:hypothetical protein